MSQEKSDVSVVVWCINQIVGDFLYAAFEISKPSENISKNMTLELSTIQNVRSISRTKGIPGFKGSPKNIEYRRNGLVFHNWPKLASPNEWEASFSDLAKELPSKCVLIGMCSDRHLNDEMMKEGREALERAKLERVLIQEHALLMEESSVYGKDIKKRRKI